MKSTQHLSSPSKWSLRQATPKDKPQILALHERVFHVPLSEPQWDWQFMHNPTAKAVVWVAVTPEGKIVGHHCLIPIPFWKEGKRTIAAYSILSMIDPAFQRQGMLKALANASENQFTQEVTPTRLTFLNDNSLPVYTHSLGWTEVGKKPPIYFAILNLKPLAVKAVGGKIAPLFSPLLAWANKLFHPKKREFTPEFEITESQSFDAALDELWECFSHSIHFSTLRDAQYLNWRFFKNPKQYCVFQAKKGGKLVAFIAFRSEKKFGYRMGYIADLLFSPAEPKAGEALLSHALARLREEGCAIVTSLVPPHAPTQTLYRGFRFFPLPKLLMPHGMHFCFKGDMTDFPHFQDKNNWYLSWSDHDIV